ncbi:MAG: MFS transporter [Thermoprotei archaeon]|nr:MFS transporter [TACK group archaeon]
MKTSILLSIFVIVAMTFALRASNNMVLTTVPLLARYDFYMSSTEIGVISGIFSAFSFFATAFLNSRACAKRRRVYFILSSVGFAISLPLFYLATPLTLWLLAAFSGFVLGFLMPNIVTAAGLFEDPKTRERVLAIYTLSLSTSLIVGPSLEGLILMRFTLRQAFLFFAPLGVLTAVLSPTIRFPESELREPAKFKEVSANPYFLTAIFNILSYNVPFAILMAFGGIYARDVFGASYAQIELLFAVFFAASFTFRLMLSLKHFDDLFKLTYFAIALTLAGLSLMTASTSLTMLAISFLLLGVPHGLTYPISLIYISRGFQERLRNAANSYFFSLMMAIGVAIPFVAGAIISLIGIRLTYFSLVLPVVTLLALIRWNQIRLKKEAQRPSVGRAASWIRARFRVRDVSCRDHLVKDYRR